MVETVSELNLGSISHEIIESGGEVDEVAKLQAGCIECLSLLLHVTLSTPNSAFSNGTAPWNTKYALGEQTLRTLVGQDNGKSAFPTLPEGKLVVPSLESESKRDVVVPICLLPRSDASAAFRICMANVL